MALLITDECINCDVCEPECPNQAISMGAGDLRDRPAALHRVRRPLRRAAVRAGLPGELHPGRPGARRVEGDAVGQVPAPAAGRPRPPARVISALPLPACGTTAMPSSAATGLPLAFALPLAAGLGRAAEAPARRRAERCRRAGAAAFSPPCARAPVPAAALRSASATRRASARCAAVRGSVALDRPCRRRRAPASRSGRRGRSGRSAPAPASRRPQASSEARSRVASWRSPGSASPAPAFGRGGFGPRRLGVDLHHRALHLAGQQQVERRQRLRRCLLDRLALVGRRLAQHVVDHLGLHARVADAQAQAPVVGACRAGRGCPSGRCGRRGCRRA